MKNGIITLSLLLSAAAFARSDVKENILRDFTCEGAYSNTNQSGSKTFSARMVDYSLTDDSDANYIEYLGGMALDAGFTPQNVKIVWTEAKGSDIETERDDDPSGRQGWGGKALYAAIIKGTMQNPQEVFVFLTIAAKEQQGKPLRDYQVAALKMTKSDEQGSDQFEQEIIAEGMMTCKQL